MLFYSVLALTSLAVLVQCQNIVLTNDDGWATAQIRAQNDALNAAGFNVILSAPAEQESGTGSDTATPTPLTQPCEFNTCPTGSPAEGFNASNSRLNWVNSFPVDAVRFGIQTLSPEFFGGPPDFVVSGPNIGTNLGSGITGSGTVGAACEAAKEGIPSTAFSGTSTSQVSFTTLETNPTSTATLAALAYAQLTATFTKALLASSARPVLPASTTINVNFPSTSGCSAVSDFKFVFTRLIANSSATDVTTCGTDHLPDETTVVHSSGCHVSVTVIDANTKKDVEATRQAAVLNRISSMLTCFD
ncbi:SurE-like protein [Phanerochaete sordida]|uniref:SurE-like protein n=1 Tax=Phanerochaete sordida TaxID=48140 RepID=A0A9P3LNI3_9APHY|nr:SurE-like protein [Phanerochaete sordida]